MVSSIRKTQKECIERGFGVEDAFIQDWILQEGGTMRKASLTEDTQEHKDVFWNRGDGSREYSFDVKGGRKKSRQDENISWETTWLELQNVKGEPGSLYGKADYFAFETQNEWLIARRSQLLKELLKEMSGDTEIRTENSKENPLPCYKRYQRAQWGRKDIIVKVPIGFIEKCTVKHIRKK